MVVSLFARYSPYALSSRRILVAILIGLLLGGISALMPTVAAAQSAACSGQTEPELRQRALDSLDLELTRRYLACFPYGDGANSVRAKEKKLQETAACRVAASSNNPDELRAFISQWSQSECASSIALRLSQLIDISRFNRYPSSLFSGTVAKRGTIDTERACALTCKASGPACLGYSFADGSKACTLWSRIDSRTPRGDTVSGSLAPVDVSISPAQQRSPAQSAPTTLQPGPATGAMRYLQGMDLPNGDYLNYNNITIEHCDALCKQQGACGGFTYNTRANACFLKNAVGVPIPSANAISGFKSSTNPINSPLRPMQILEKVDLPNSNPADDYALLPQTSFGACRTSCEQDRQCAAFTYNHNANACILKRAYGRRLISGGATSGVK
jgi:hypothetical protein